MLLLLFLSSAISSGSSGREPAFSSHLLPPHPSWQATRGAQAATSPDAASGIGNPAALTGAGSCRLTFTHLAWAGDLSREWMAAAWRLPNGWDLTADAGLLRTPPLEGFDEHGHDTGSFRPMEWTAGVAVRLPLGRAASAGLGVRTFRLEDQNSPLSGFGGSIGLHWAGSARRFGIALTDAGPETSGGQVPAPLPTRWRAGFEQDLEAGQWTLALLAEGGPESSPRLIVGVVARPVTGLELLAGLASGTGGEPDPLGHWSAGGRFRHGPVELSYAYLPGGNLEPTHHLGVALSFGETARYLEHETPGR